MKDFKNYFADPLLQDTFNVEYSSLGGFPGNSEPHFRDAIRRGFDGLKCDMRLTSDGVVVLCHDAGYTFDANGRITRFDSKNFTAIHDLTFAQVSALEFDTPLADGSYCHPCTLETMMGLCEEYHVVPYLTIRHEPWRRDVAVRMVEFIKSHHLAERTIINIFPATIETVNIVRELLPGLVYCNTCLSTTPLSAELVDSTVADGYGMICLCRKQIESVTPDKLRYAADKGVRIWTWGASSSEEVACDLAHGATGFQMCTRKVDNGCLAELYAKALKER